MLGKTINDIASVYKNKELQDFIEHPLWKQLCLQLKNMPRAGYEKLGYRGMDVIDLYTHFERISKAATLLGNHENVDINLLQVMAYVHDFIEVFTGNILFDEAPSDSKGNMENGIWRKRILPSLDDALPLYDIWVAYDRRECREAHLIWEVDMMEPLIEALEFYNTHPAYRVFASVAVPEIIKVVKEKITHPHLITILEKLDDVETQHHLTFDGYCQWLSTDTLS